MTVLGGISDSMFGRLFLRVFFRAVRRGVRDDSGHFHAVPDVLIERNCVTLDLPVVALRIRQFVLLVAVALLQTARQRPDFLVSSFLLILRR